MTKIQKILHFQQKKHSLSKIVFCTIFYINFRQSIIESQGVKQIILSFLFHDYDKEKHNI